MTGGSAGRDQLAVALDLPFPAAQALYRTVSPHIGYAKVGLSLFIEHGPPAVHALQQLGAKIFLDLKLHDIPNTVHLAARRAAELGVDLFTVHAQGGEGMLRAAVEGAVLGSARSGLPRPKVLAVTVLTSLGDEDLAAMGYAARAGELVRQLALLALRAGADGVVCSAREAKALRELLGPAAFLCTPGIRPEGTAQQDQNRVETPERAIQAGANLLVVGRPIHAAPDPAEAARRLAAAVSSA